MAGRGAVFRSPCGDQFDELERFFADASNITVGWSTAFKEKYGALDLSMKALPDTSLAASIDLLAEYDKARVIPSLLLYHPSRAVVLRTLEVLTTSDRRDFAGPARRGRC